MSKLTDNWAIVNTGLYIDQYDNSEIPKPVADLLETIVGDVEALKEAATTPAPVLVNMTRAEALKTAREHVEAMSMKANGYQDAKLSDKIQAVSDLARFLMGETA